MGIADLDPVRVLHPVICRGSKDWREYYRNNNLNMPEQYHNACMYLPIIVCSKERRRC